MMVLPGGPLVIAGGGSGPAPQKVPSAGASSPGPAPELALRQASGSEEARAAQASLLKMAHSAGLRLPPPTAVGGRSCGGGVGPVAAAEPEQAAGFFPHCPVRRADSPLMRVFGCPAATHFHPCPRHLFSGARLGPRVSRRRRAPKWRPSAAGARLWLKTTPLPAAAGRLPGGGRPLTRLGCAPPVSRFARSGARGGPDAARGETPLGAVMTAPRAARQFPAKAFGAPLMAGGVSARRRPEL
jgi:hypothetical protein